MFSRWIQNAKFQAVKDKSRSKIWNSTFASDIYNEVMRDNPTYIAIESHRISWGNDLRAYPTRSIRYFDRGYQNLENVYPLGLEVEALNDYFIMKSGNKYRLVADEDNMYWPYNYLTCKENKPVSLKKW